MYPMCLFASYKPSIALKNLRKWKMVTHLPGQKTKLSSKVWLPLGIMNTKKRTHSILTPKSYNVPSNLSSVYSLDFCTYTCMYTYMCVHICIHIYVYMYILQQINQDSNIYIYTDLYIQVIQIFWNKNIHYLKFTTQPLLMFSLN